MLFHFQPTKDQNQQVITKLRVASGLADLACMRYKNAAKQFLSAHFDSVDFPEVNFLYDLKEAHCSKLL